MSAVEELDAAEKWLKDNDPKYVEPKESEDVLDHTIHIPQPDPMNDDLLEMQRYPDTCDVGPRTGKVHGYRIPGCYRVRPATTYG